jgi:hypothetical protein
MRVRCTDSDLGGYPNSRFGASLFSLFSLVNLFLGRFTATNCLRSLLQLTCHISLLPKRRSPPYRRQPVGRHLEFRGAFLDSRSLVRSLNLAQSDRLGSYLVDAPPDRLRRGSGFLAMPQYRPARRWVRQCTNKAKELFGQLRRHRLAARQRTTEVQKIGRATAWFILVAIIALSLVPPGARPTTFLPHKIEHAGIFLLDGLAFGIAHCDYAWLSSIGAVIFCAGIEVAQLMIPGGHARLSDFFVDAIGTRILTIAD